MYINFWYPMIRSEDLSPGKPEKVKVLGLNFAVFRTAPAKPRAERHLRAPRRLARRPLGARPAAAHRQRLRGLPLPRLGILGRRQLRQHPVDRLRHQAAGRAKVDAYPTVEKYGIVFAFLGDLPENERPPMLEVPEWDQPGWRANSCSRWT
jgi:phenylpropionate dioxygenase-like ring-hydroxylating dioxygenase large terminal subunit